MDIKSSPSGPAVYLNANASTPEALPATLTMSDDAHADLVYVCVAWVDNVDEAKRYAKLVCNGKASVGKVLLMDYVKAQKLYANSTADDNSSDNGSNEKDLWGLHAFTEADDTSAAEFIPTIPTD